MTRPTPMLGLVLSAALALPLTAGAATDPAPRYRNPILHADYSDPDVIRVGSDYYLIASTFHFSPGIPILHSRDLVHWRIAGHVLERLPFDPAFDMVGPKRLTDQGAGPVGKGERHGGGVWAPSIRHHDGRFYVYWATPDEGIFMSSAAHPTGPWTKPVTVLAGAGYEDPCPFWDDDGKAYLVHSKVGAGPLILHRMRPDGSGLLDEGKTIAQDKVKLPVLEGPKMFKRNGWYMIFAPIGGVETGPQLVMRSRSIYGPYEYRKVLLPGNGLKGPHQGGYVETEQGQGWFIHFNSTGAFDRINHLQPVAWKDDWPVMGTPVPPGVAGVPVLEGPAPRTSARSPDFKLQDSDEFSAPRLGLQWAWNHNPDNARWSLAQRPGFMRIEASQAPYLVRARNTLTQVLQGPSTRITTRLMLDGLGDKQRAGLTLFGIDVPWVGVVREGGITHVTVANGGKEQRVGPAGGTEIVLRATVRPDQTVQFAYAARDGAPFVDAGAPVKLAPTSWWKGSRPGVFTYVRSEVDGSAVTKPHKITRNFVDVDWFRVERGAPDGR